MSQDEGPEFVLRKLCMNMNVCESLWSSRVSLRNIMMRFNEYGHVVVELSGFMMCSSC